MYVMNCKSCKTKVKIPDDVYHTQCNNWSSTIYDGLCLGCLDDVKYIQISDDKTGKLLIKEKRVKR